MDDEDIINSIKQIEKIQKLESSSSYKFDISLNEYKAIMSLVNCINYPNYQFVINNSNKKIQIRQESKINVIKYFSVILFALSKDIVILLKLNNKKYIDNINNLIKMFISTYFKLLKDNYFNFDDISYLCKILLFLSINNDKNNFESLILLNYSIKLIFDSYNFNIDGSNLEILNKYINLFYKTIESNEYNLHIINKGDKITVNLINLIIIISKKNNDALYIETYSNYLNLLLLIYKFKFSYDKIMSSFIDLNQKILINIDTKSINNIKTDIFIQNLPIDYLNKVYNKEKDIKDTNKFLLESGFNLSNKQGGLYAKIPHNLGKEFIIIFSFSSDSDDDSQIVSLFSDNKNQLTITVKDNYLFLVNEANETFNTDIKIVKNISYLFIIEIDKYLNIKINYELNNKILVKKVSLKSELKTNSLTLYYGCDNYLKNSFTGKLGTLFIISCKIDKNYLQTIFLLKEKYELLINLLNFDFSYYENFCGLDNSIFYTCITRLKDDNISTKEFVNNINLVISPSSFGYNPKYFQIADGRDSSKYIKGNYLNYKNDFNLQNNYDICFNSSLNNYFYIFNNRISIIEFIQSNGISFISMQFEYYYQIFCRLLILLGLYIEPCEYNIIQIENNNKFIKSKISISNEQEIKESKELNEEEQSNIQIIVKNSVIKFIKLEQFYSELNKLFYEMKYALQKLFDLCDHFNLPLNDIIKCMNDILMLFKYISTMVPENKKFDNNKIILLRNSFMELIVNIKFKPSTKYLEIYNKLLDLIDGSKRWSPILNPKSKLKLLEIYNNYYNGFLLTLKDNKNIIYKFTKIIVNTLNSIDEDLFIQYNRLLKYNQNINLLFLNELYLIDYFNRQSKNISIEKKKETLNYLFKKLNKLSNSDNENNEVLFNIDFLIIIDIFNKNIEKDNYLQENQVKLYNFIKQCNTNFLLIIIKCIFINISDYPKQNKINILDYSDEHIFKIQNDIKNKIFFFNLINSIIYKMNNSEYNQYTDKCYNLICLNLLSIAERITNNNNFASKLIDSDNDLMRNLFFYRYQIIIKIPEIQEIISYCIRWKKHSFIYDFILQLYNSNHIVNNDNEDNIINKILNLICDELEKICLDEPEEKILFPNVEGSLNTTFSSNAEGVLSNNTINNKKILFKNLINLLLTVSFVIKNKYYVFINKETIFRICDFFTNTNLIQSQKTFYCFDDNLYSKPFVEMLFDLLIISYKKYNDIDYLNKIKSTFIKNMDKTNETNFNLLEIKEFNSDTYFISYAIDLNMHLNAQNLKSKNKNNKYFDKRLIKRNDKLLNKYADIYSEYECKCNVTVYFLVKVLAYYFYFTESKKKYFLKNLMILLLKNVNDLKKINAFNVNKLLIKAIHPYDLLLDDLKENSYVDNLENIKQNLKEALSGSIKNFDDMLDYSYYLTLSTCNKEGMKYIDMMNVDKNNEKIRKEEDKNKIDSYNLEQQTLKSKSSNRSFSSKEDLTISIDDTRVSQKNINTPENGLNQSENNENLEDSENKKQNSISEANSSYVSNSRNSSINISNKKDIKKEPFKVLYEDSTIKLQDENFKPFIIICGNMSSYNSNDSLDYNYFNPKKEFVLTNFSNNFYNLLFNNDLFIKLKSMFKSYFLSLNDIRNNINKSNDLYYASSKVLNYPSRIRNYSNFFEPPIFLKQYFSFFDNLKFLEITHNYFYKYYKDNKTKLINNKINFYKKVPGEFICKKDSHFYVDYISNSSNLLGELLITENGYLIFISQDRKNLNLNSQYGSTYVFSDISFTHEFKNKIIYINYREIKEIITRRYLLMWQAIEIYLYNGKSYFFNFFRHHFSMLFIEGLKPHLENPKELSIHKYFYEEKNYIEKWKNKELTTYDFLLYLNKFASRTYNEPNQYPVFPWVLNQDYYEELMKSNDSSLNGSFSTNSVQSSLEYNSVNKGDNQVNDNGILSRKESITQNDEPKTTNKQRKTDFVYTNEYNFNYRDFNYPISCQLPERRCVIQQRYKDSFGKFKRHLGTHYTTSGYVYYYLMRQLPYTHSLIKLQNYTQEATNRMFYNPNSTIKVLCNSNDSREILPEFFSCIECFINLNCVDFGMRIKNKKYKILDDIKVSKNEGRLNKYASFIYNHRKIINNNDVRYNIPKWINYVFGVNQYPKDPKRIIESCVVFNKSSYQQFYNLENKLEKIKYKIDKREIDKNKVVQEAIEQIGSKIVFAISFGSTPYKLLNAELEPRIYHKEYFNQIKKIKNVSENDDIYYYLFKVCDFNKCTSDKPLLFYAIDNKFNICNYYYNKEEHKIQYILEREKITNISTLNLYSTFYKEKNDNKLLIDSYINGLTNSFIIINQASNSNIVLSVNHLTKSIKVNSIKNLNMNYELYLDDYATCIAKKEDTNTFYVGTQKGKLLEMFYDTKINNIIPKKSIMAHKGSIKSIYYNKRLNILLTYGEDSIIYIRKAYDFELLSIIKINSKLKVISMKMSIMNFVYILAYVNSNDDKKPFIIQGFTVNGIKFAESENGFYNNFSFTESGNLIVGDCLSRNLNVFYAYDLKLKGDIPTDLNGGKEKRLMWFEYSYYYEAGNKINMLLYSFDDKGELIFIQDNKYNSLLE